MPGITILETSRLKLVTWQESDVSLLKQLYSTIAMTRHLYGGAPWSEAKCEERLREWIREHAQDGCTKYKMLTRDGDRFIGMAGFSLFTEVVHDFVLGYALEEAEWGKGYATEIASALCDWFFARNIARRFIAFAHPDNLASLRVLEKIGMRSRMPISSEGMSCPAFEMSRT